jgi:hypothetical protein
LGHCLSVLAGKGGSGACRVRIRPDLWQVAHAVSHVLSAPLRLFLERVQVLPLPCIAQGTLSVHDFACVVAGELFELLSKLIELFVGLRRFVGGGRRARRRSGLDAAWEAEPKEGFGRLSLAAR